jgi:hypothetical protein
LSIKRHAFTFEHPLLLVMRQHDAARGTGAARIDYSMPGNLIAGPMHYEANSSRRVMVAEQLRDLSVSHDSS